MKQLIKNFTIDETELFFASIGEKAYRARQLYAWMYGKNVATFDEMSNYSKSLRALLKQKCVVSPLICEDRQTSQIDGTEKFLFKTYDGHYIESVLLKNDFNDTGRLTICISSQIGCQMGCTFCHTARIPFIRNLETAEILDQINQVRRLSGLSNNNIVFMGMGEPFMNYNNVIKAATIMNYTFGFHLSVRKITISTCGILPRIEQFIEEEHLFNLAVSLNDTSSEKRSVSMPINRKYPLEKLADLFNKKMPKAHNRLTLEYVLRKDNISKDDAKRLKKLFKYSRIKLNLIPLNCSTDNTARPSDEEIESFIKELEILNIPITVRKSLGSDIDGACGQLSGKKYSDSL
ncbi:MAG: 23S rRNA (adenine(2503)-C(2))-methyltransferase RlmN [Spirochaetes bacterium]|jgi:23S rRNA (adenine2503-C2)-methyltransferase|nr:23S rRNA (adenine(2503)-C(2))-methyltransferase RlmN [Spirochaetota bacterium]